jgi:hypothetical protein
MLVTRTSCLKTLLWAGEVTGCCRLMAPSLQTGCISVRSSMKRWGRSRMYFVIRGYWPSPGNYRATEYVLHLSGWTLNVIGFMSLKHSAKPTGLRRVISSGIELRVGRWKSTDVSEEHVAFIYRIEVYAKRETCLPPAFTLVSRLAYSSILKTVIGFTEHLQILTTSNCSAIANSHSQQFTTART